jgi:hypothetical protein
LLGKEGDDVAVRTGKELSDEMKTVQKRLDK